MYFGTFGLGCLFVPELVRTRPCSRKLCQMHLTGINTTYFGNLSCLKAGASSSGGLRHVLACFGSLLPSQRAQQLKETDSSLFQSLEEVLELASMGLSSPQRLTPRSSISCRSITQIFIIVLGTKDQAGHPRKEKKHDTISTLRCLIIGALHKYLYYKVW